MLNLPVNPSDLILTVAQRDYVSRGKRSAPARTRRNNKKARKPLPVMAIGLAVLLIAGWFGVRKRVHEIHSTAPVHPDDEKHDAPLVEETSR